MHVGRKRLAKIHQILLVKIAKLGGGKWGNEFGSALARVAISEGERWVVVVGEGVRSWLEKYPRLSLAHRTVCARGKALIAGAYYVDSPGVIISLAGWAEPTLSPAHRPFICRR
jgi:hypothetical protein